MESVRALVVDDDEALLVVTWENLRLAFAELGVELDAYLSSSSISSTDEALERSSYRLVVLPGRLARSDFESFDIPVNDLVAAARQQNPQAVILVLTYGSVQRAEELAGYVAAGADLVYYRSQLVGDGWRKLAEQVYSLFGLSDDPLPHPSRQPASITSLVEIGRTPSGEATENLLRSVEPLVEAVQTRLHDGAWAANVGLEQDLEVALAGLRNEMYPLVDRPPDRFLVERLSLRLMDGLHELLRQGAGLSDPSVVTEALEEFRQLTGTDADGRSAARIADRLADAIKPDDIPDSAPRDLVDAAASEPRRTLAMALGWIADSVSMQNVRADSTRDILRLITRSIAVGATIAGIGASAPASIAGVLIASLASLLRSNFRRRTDTASDV